MKLKESCKVQYDSTKETMPADMAELFIFDKTSEMLDAMVKMHR